MTVPIEASVDLAIEHSSGPVVADPNHVRAWLTADGQWIDGGRNGFTFEVCPLCPDPDFCEHHDSVAVYRATIVSASW